MKCQILDRNSAFCLGQFFKTCHRLTVWLRLEGTPEGRLVQPPQFSRGHPKVAVQNLVQVVLNISKNGIHNLSG